MFRSETVHEAFLHYYGRIHKSDCVSIVCVPVFSGGFDDHNMRSLSDITVGNGDTDILCDITGIIERKSIVMLVMAICHICVFDLVNYVCMAFLLFKLLSQIYYI